jgi:hypothetical protein
MGDVTPEDVRRLALALPETHEQPHFERTSFRVGTSIFATLPPDAATLNVLLDEPEARASAEEAPDAVELLWWGRKLSGVQVFLERADEGFVQELLEDAWRRRAPRRLVQAYDAGRAGPDDVR